MSTEYNGRKPEYKEYAEPNLTRTLSVPSEGAFEAAFYVDDSRDEKPPKRYAPHIHDTLEIYFLLDGESSFSVENKIYKLGAGDAVISRPNELHYCLHDRTARHSHACIGLRPTPNFCSATSSDPSAPAFPCPSPKKPSLSARCTISKPRETTETNRLSTRILSIY